MSESGIVTGMGTPGTYRVSDGGPLPGDLDMHAAEERLRCYQSFGADLPPGGGRPALTPQIAARRVWLARQSRADAPSSLCPSCNLAAEHQACRTGQSQTWTIMRQTDPATAPNRQQDWRRSERESDHSLSWPSAAAS